MRRDGSQSLRTLHSAIDGDGDVSVGAFARRLRRHHWLMATIGLALLLTAGVVYVMLSAQPGGKATPAVVIVRSLSTGAEFELPMDAQRVYPAVCPDTGSRDCYPVWECRACNERFVPADTSETVKCPECGSTRVGAARQRTADGVPE